MSSDPIIAEIHSARERLWELCHGNAEEFAERQRRWEEEHPERMIDVAQWWRDRKLTTEQSPTSAEAR